MSTVALHSTLNISETVRIGICTIKWLRDQWRHVILKGQTHDPNTLRAQYLEKRLEIETPFQRTTNRIWRGLLNGTWPMTSRKPRRCCGAVRSAILATAWLLVTVNKYFKLLFEMYFNQPFFIFLATCHKFFNKNLSLRSRGTRGPAIAEVPVVSYSPITSTSWLFFCQPETQSSNFNSFKQHK